MAGTWQRIASRRRADQPLRFLTEKHGPQNSALSLQDGTAILFALSRRPTPQPNRLQVPTTLVSESDNTDQKMRTPLQPELPCWIGKKRFAHFAHLAHLPTGKTCNYLPNSSRWREKVRKVRKVRVRIFS